MDPDVPKLLVSLYIIDRKLGIQHTNTNLTVETEYMLMVLELKNIY